MVRGGRGDPVPEHERRLGPGPARDRLELLDGRGHAAERQRHVGRRPRRAPARRRRGRSSSARRPRWRRGWPRPPRPASARRSGTRRRGCRRHPARGGRVVSAMGAQRCHAGAGQSTVSSSTRLPVGVAAVDRLAHRRRSRPDGARAPRSTSTPAAASAVAAPSIGPDHRKQRSAEPGVGASAWGAAGADAGWTLNREPPTCSRAIGMAPTDEQVVVQPLGAEGPLVPVEGGLDVGDGDGDVIEPFDRHVRPLHVPPGAGHLILAQRRRTPVRRRRRDRVTGWQRGPRPSTPTCW